jgi:hypothetical protein
VLYWEWLWRAWSNRHQRGEPLRLHPVLPARRKCPELGRIAAFLRLVILLEDLAGAEIGVPC